MSGNATSATHADSADFADHTHIADAAASADYATKATQDGNGNTISSYYCTLSTEQTIRGKKTFDGNNVDFILKDNERYISFRYSQTYQSWTWITCYNGASDNNIILHFTNNNTDVIQLTHACTSESVNNIQKVKSLLTAPSVDNVWQLGSSNKRLSNIYTTTLYSTDIGDFGNEVDRICTNELFANYIGNIDVPVARVYADALGSPSTPIETMFISGGHANRYIVIDNSGTEPTIAPDTTNCGYLGTSTKHWFKAYINNLYIGAGGYSLLAYIASSISGTNSTNTAVGSIRFIRINVTNKDSDITIFSAGSNVSGYTIYQGSLANGSFNYQTSALTGTWKLLSELMTPSGITSETYSGSLYAIAIRVA